MKLVCQLQSYGDPLNVVPLFLSGPAFTVYDQLAESSKKSYDEVEKALICAFSLDRFSAYDEFRKRTWKHGETVDNFLADLRRLSSLAKVTSEELIQQAFVVGLPIEASAQLRSYVEVAESQSVTVTTEMLLSQARVYVTQVGAMMGMMAVNRTASRITCYNCGKEGHISRNCVAPRKTAVKDEKARCKTDSSML